MKRLKTSWLLAPCILLCVLLMLQIQSSSSVTKRESQIAIDDAEELIGDVFSKLAQAEAEGIEPTATISIVQNLKTALELVNKARGLHSNGGFNESLPLAERAFTIAEETKQEADSLHKEASEKQHMFRTAVILFVFIAPLPVSLSLFFALDRYRRSQTKRVLAMRIRRKVRG